MSHSSLVPHTVASASADGTCKVWAGPQLAQRAHSLCPAGKAAVCAASFSSLDPHLLALACADCRGYIYDLRSARQPLHVRPLLAELCWNHDILALQMRTPGVHRSAQ